MSKYFLVIGVAIAFAAPACAGDTYTIDPQHAFPVFEISHLGFSTQRGRFNRTSGRLALDRDARTGSVALIIDATSLDMGFDKWNQIMLGEDFFDAGRFPTITYASDHLIFDTAGAVVAADGQLTLIGATQPLRVTVRGFQCALMPMNLKPLCAGDVTATLKRSDFGMTKYLPLIGDEVRISVPVEAYKD